MDTPSRTVGGPKEETNTDGRASPSSDHPMLGNVTTPLPGTSGICTPATHTDASLPSSSDNTLQGSGAAPLQGTSEIYTMTTQADANLPLPSDNTQQGTVAAPLPGTGGTISSVTVSMEDASVSKVSINFDFYPRYFVYCIFYMSIVLINHICFIHLSNQSIWVSSVFQQLE